MATATRSALTALTEFCEMTYGVPALETRILVSTYLPTRYLPLWIMVDAEKGNFLTDLEYAVMKLEHPAILDTYYLRQRSHMANKYVMVLVSAREKVQIFANRYWDWPGPAIFQRSQYALVATECLRLRLEFDASKQPGLAARDQLFKLVRQALHEAQVDPRAGIVPVPLGEVFYRRAGVLRLVDWFLRSPTTLMRNFGFVVANHAALSGRAAPNEEDLQVARYMLRNAVPVWAEQILRVLLERGSRSISWKEVVRETGQATQWQKRYGGINTGRAQRLGARILQDFHTTGLVEQNLAGRYSLKPQYADDLEHILEARA